MTNGAVWTKFYPGKPVKRRQATAAHATLRVQFVEQAGLDVAFQERGDGGYRRTPNTK